MSERLTRFGGLPFVVEGFSDDLDHFIESENEVSLRVGVMRHMCYKCRAEGGVPIAIPFTCHDTDAVLPVFAGGQIAQYDLLHALREQGAFAKARWAVGPIRMVKPDKRSPIAVSHCPSCDAVWMPGNFRTPALGAADDLASGEDSERVSRIADITAHGNPMRLLDDRGFTNAIVSRLKLEALVGRLTVDRVDRVFLATARGLETRPLPSSFRDDRETFYNDLIMVTIENNAFGYGVVYLERGNGEAVVEHANALENNVPLRGVNVYVRGKGLYHVFGDFYPDAALIENAGRYRVARIDQAALAHLATPWPLRGYLGAQVIPGVTPAAREQKDSPSDEDRMAAGVSVYVGLRMAEYLSLCVQDVVWKMLGEKKAGGVLILTSDDRMARDIMPSLRESLATAEMSPDGERISGVVVLSAESFRNSSELVSLFTPYEYVVIVPPGDGSNVWWWQYDVREKIVRRLSRIAVEADVRCMVMVPADVIEGDRRKDELRFWNVKDLKSAVSSLHLFTPMPSAIKRLGASPERAKRIMSIRDLSPTGEVQYRWYERIAEGRNTYVPIVDPNVASERVEIFERELSNPDIDDVFYRWRRKDFARFRVPRSPKELLTGFARVRDLGVGVPRDLVFFLSKTDGCETRVGSVIYPMAEVLRSVDPSRGRLSIGSNAAGEYFDIRADGGVDVRRRGSPGVLRSFSTFASFLNHLGSETPSGV